MDTLSRPTPAELVPKAVKTMVTDKTNTGMTLTVNGSGYGDTDSILFQW